MLRQRGLKPHQKLRRGVLENKIKSRALVRGAESDGFFYDEENPPVYGPFDFMPQGFHETYLVLTSPKADGSTNRDDSFLLPDPFGLPPSRVAWHHEISLADAQQRDPSNHVQDCGENWCIRKTADLCEAIYGVTRQLCAGQLLATKLHEDDYSYFNKALRDHADGVINKTYKTDQESKIKDDCFDERLAVFEEYVKRGPEDFHTSVIGPLCLYDEYKDDYDKLFLRHGVQEHVRIYTGFFNQDVTNNTNIIADFFHLHPELYDENGNRIDGGDY
jgi:hypothetical protein